MSEMTCKLNYRNPVRLRLSHTEQIRNALKIRYSPADLVYNIVNLQFLRKSLLFHLTLMTVDGYLPLLPPTYDLAITMAQLSANTYG